MSNNKDVEPVSNRSEPENSGEPESRGKISFSFWVIVSAFIASTVLGLGTSAAGFDTPIAWTAAITLFTAILWVTEALPIPATSLIPFFAFPLTGVLSHSEAASSLGSHVIILLMGAFMLSKGIEKSNVHQRFALYMIRITGGQSAKRLVFAFMITAAALSMWISNTATTLMLLPIALAVLQPINNPRVAIAILLGIAYAASLGGVGTPIGTPPNIIFMSVYQEHTGTEINFIEWMKFGVPIVLLAIPVMALWLTRGLGELNDFHLPEVGEWRSQERRVIGVFACVALAWITRPFWTEALQLNSVGDSTIALAGVVAMFMVPTGSGVKNDRLLDWQTANNIPWGMLLLFAGGICIAKAFTASGLSKEIGNFLSVLNEFPLLLLILSICIFVTFLTEITSNTATATLLMPILAVTGSSMGIDPALLMIPAAISASCAFMLPVATAPNAIVYGTDKFKISDMAKEGAVLNILVACVVATVSYLSLG
ncbi:SLC13/DASS family transporter [Paraneptunicella aestuarii]|uniref:SLC13 family permease n=1 Tax=Paraneptunicella aestuarii TaxID=2831148 RepID=UPI001E2A2D6D|nr:SLC13 family permease [Paraneptunicella aestuarii]UAA40228.1 SLC13/DASS family transporter [Paraneptunicella aestuarii]